MDLGSLLIFDKYWGPGRSFFHLFNHLEISDNLQERKKEAYAILYANSYWGINKKNSLLVLYHPLLAALRHSTLAHSSGLLQRSDQ